MIFSVFFGSYPLQVIQAVVCSVPVFVVNISLAIRVWYKRVRHRSMEKKRDCLLVAGVKAYSNISSINGFIRKAFGHFPVCNPANFPTAVNLVLGALAYGAPFIVHLPLLKFRTSS